MLHPLLFWLTDLIYWSDLCCGICMTLMYQYWLWKMYSVFCLVSLISVITLVKTNLRNANLVEIGSSEPTWTITQENVNRPMWPNVSKLLLIMKWRWSLLTRPKRSHYFRRWEWNSLLGYISFFGVVIEILYSMLFRLHNFQNLAENLINISRIRIISNSYTWDRYQTL